MLEMKKICDMRQLQRNEDMFAEGMAIINLSDFFTPPTDNIPWTTCYHGEFINHEKGEIRSEQVQFKIENNAISSRDGGVILGKYETDRKFKW